VGSKLLALELRYIAKLDVDLDLTVTGLEIGEIDVLLGAATLALLLELCRAMSSVLR
jgi:hypothetical protein